MPREPLDVPEDLPKQALRQVALGKLALGKLEREGCGKVVRDQR
jgi:hypothetical protein